MRSSGGLVEILTRSTSKEARDNRSLSPGNIPDSMVMLHLQSCHDVYFVFAGVFVGARVCRKEVFPDHIPG